jgi:cell division protein FtsN
MSRDYKNAKRHAGSAKLSGVAGFVLGLALGLSVAFGVYLYDRRPEARMAGPTAREEPSRRTAATTPTPEEPETEFDFYEMLPKFEVVIPEQGEDPRKATNAPTPVQKPGAYVLQAGSFRNHADADRIRALIALQGVESKIQKVTFDKETWHRVRIGPITNLQKLEETRSKLRQARIEALVIPVSQ